MSPFRTMSRADTLFQPSIYTSAEDEKRTSRNGPGAANPPPSNHPEDLRGKLSPMLQTDLTESGLRRDSSTAISRLEINLSRLSELLKDGPGSTQECIVSTMLLYLYTLLWDVLAPERPLEPV
jgi:hypothetical protein